MTEYSTTVIITHDRFLTRFYYDSDTNIMKENLFRRFDLPSGIILHRDLGEKLYSLVPVLKALHLKFLLTDVFRPVEMQKFLYEHWKERTGAEPKFSLAEVDKAPHPRGIACDCVLADEEENKLPLPSSSIKVNPEQRNHDFEFEEQSTENAEKIRNRNLLRTLMLCAGISPINKEWFHFQLPNTEEYELISVKDARSVNPMFYDIFGDYQNEETACKTHSWIHDRKYYERFSKIGLDEFVAKIKEKFCV